MKYKEYLGQVYAVCHTADQVNAARDRGENIWIETGNDIVMSGRFKRVRIIRCGNYDAIYATFEGNYYAGGATFEGYYYASAATFEGYYYASYATFKGDYYAGDATFKGDYDARGATFEGDYDAGGATFEGSISFGHTQYNGPTWIDEFQGGPMLELLDACPGGRDAASGAWGNTSWANCPLHDALGMKPGKDASYKDVDAIIASPRLRLAARMFVPLHDAGLLKPLTTLDTP